MNYKAKTKSGDEWLPTYLNYINHKKCIGCGRCVWACYNGCYELREVDGKVKSYVNDSNVAKCFGDCHCHTVCPTQAMVCKPMEIEEFKYKAKANPKATANPEEGYSLRKGGEPWKQNFDLTIEEEKCTGCGDCIAICQQMVFDLKKVDGREVAEIVAPEMCMGDMHCTRVCKENAIIIKASPQVEYRQIRSKFQGRATRELVVEYGDGSMERRWEYV